VDFRLVMFRPFVGEVLIAKLKTCDKSGLYLSLGSFFDDIHIPEHLLQQPSTFDEDEKLWVWNYNGTPMYMDLDEDVRIFLLCVVLVSRIEGTDRERQRLCAHGVMG
jgi:DNA-directed RNA polymerase III subunit RPC8